MLTTADLRPVAYNNLGSSSIWSRGSPVAESENRRPSEPGVASSGASHNSDVSVRATIGTPSTPAGSWSDGSLTRSSIRYQP